MPLLTIRRVLAVPIAFLNALTCRGMHFMGTAIALSHTKSIKAIYSWIYAIEMGIFKF